MPARAWEFDSPRGHHLSNPEGSQHLKLRIQSIFSIFVFGNSCLGRWLAETFLTPYFLYKITVAKKSEIKLTREGKTASYSNYEDQAEKLISIYKNIEDAGEDFFKKSS